MFHAFKILPPLSWLDSESDVRTSMKMKIEKQLTVAEEPLISQAKAAELCGMTRAAVHDLVRLGHFRSIEAGGRDLVYLREVEAFAKGDK